MMYSDLTVLTANYNYSNLTIAMIKSILKSGNNPRFLILDNSDKFYFNTIIPGINIFDNTNNHMTGEYNQGSKNHCASIDYALKYLITTKYVLLCDCDILVFPNITELFNEYHNYDVIGTIGWDDAPPVRILPYLCFINVEKFKKENLNYFDENRCIEPEPIACYDGPCGKNTKRWYHDTGASFYEDIKDTWNIKGIDINKYCVHHKAATMGNHDVKPWLEYYKNLWI